MPESKDIKILIADDEKPLARALSLKLSGEGYQTTVVNDGQSVLDQIKKDKFDLLLLDLIMPKVDGFGVLKEIKKSGVKIPVFVLSNLGQQEDIDRTKEYGVENYVVKSNTPLASIVKMVNQFLSNDR
jgi:CheY-like chemotaxis protein